MLKFHGLLGFETSKIEKSVVTIIKLLVPKELNFERL